MGVVGVFLDGGKDVGFFENPKNFLVFCGFA